MQRKLVKSSLHASAEESGFEASGQQILFYKFLMLLEYSNLEQYTSFLKHIICKLAFIFLSISSHALSTILRRNVGEILADIYKTSGK